MTVAPTPSFYNNSTSYKEVLEILWLGLRLWTVFFFPRREGMALCSRLEDTTLGFTQKKKLFGHV